jgi:hypothetical protein
LKRPAKADSRSRGPDLFGSFGGWSGDDHQTAFFLAFNTLGRVVVDHQDDLMTAAIAGRMITARVGCVDGAGPGMDAVGAALLADAVWSLRRVF